MKKLLVLMLVLGLTSVANATLTIVVGGNEVGDSIEIAEYTTIDIGIYSDVTGGAGNTGQFVAYLAIENAPTPYGSWTGGNSYYSPPAVGGGGTGNIYWDLQGSQDIWECIASNGIPTDYALPGVAADFEFKCDKQPGDVLIGLYDDIFALVDSITVHQIPEPATMLLLGLGGLLLRRRR